MTNSRSATPDRLNDEEHFAYVIGYKDGNVRPYGLISRAETTTIFFRLLKDSGRRRQPPHQQHLHRCGG